ncbi:MAG: hypothetical protein DRK00_06555, partial [Thermoprotei archaeon]
AKLSEAQPQAEAEFRGWRLYFKMPLVSGEWEMSATRIIAIPRLTEIVGPLLAARLITVLMKPSVMAVMGPAGSGKTTLINSLLNEVIAIWPSLRIAVVEQVRELVLPNVATIARSVAGPNTPVTLLIRQSLRYERPEVFVLGELRSEEIWSWVEAGRLGIGTLTTIHAPSLEKAIKTMAQLMRQNLPDATEEDVLRLVDAFTLSRKYILLDGTIARRVEIAAVSAVEGGRVVLQPVYRLEEGHLPEEEFLQLLPDRLLTGETEDVYNLLKTRFKVRIEEVEFAELEPMTIK